MADLRLKKQYINNIPVLVADDEYAQEKLKEMPLGKAIDIKYTFPRNPGNHSRFFAFLNIAFDSQDHFDNIHHFRKWLIMKSGHYSIIKAPNGYEIFDADSIAWNKMDEPEFRETFSDCVNAFISGFGKIIPEEKIDEIIRF